MRRSRQRELRVEGAFTKATLLDPDTGRVLPVVIDGNVLTITLEPARGVVLTVER